MNVHRITESENGRGWKGLLWVILSNPPMLIKSSSVCEEDTHKSQTKKQTACVHTYVYVICNKYM